MEYVKKKIYYEILAFRFDNLSSEFIIKNKKYSMILIEYVAALIQIYWLNNQSLDIFTKYKFYSESASSEVKT